MIVKETFSCIHSPKTRILTFDGGLGEVYCLEICHNCYKIQNKKFVIKEEIISSKRSSRQILLAKKKQTSIIMDPLCGIGGGPMDNSNKEMEVTP